jgi:NAD(P)-dependent dehydrogenase (short-subunit alcohol dehydrogenase family)
MDGYLSVTHYGANTAAILGFTRTVAIELADVDVTIDAVLSGFVQTSRLGDLDKTYLDGMWGSFPSTIYSNLREERSTFDSTCRSSKRRHFSRLRIGEPPSCWELGDVF